MPTIEEKRTTSFSLENLVKPGIKSVEFWVTIVTTLLMTIWPDFPKDAAYALYAWVIARSGQKFFGVTDPTSGKPSWKTSEFWITIVYAIAKSVFSDLPQDSLYAVLAWVSARTGIKLTTGLKGK